jgi:hypothetical protein
VTVLASKVADASNSSNAMASNYSFSFSTERPSPAVGSTSPTDGQTKVQKNAIIVLAFNEPVAVKTGWFTIVCSTSGSHTAAVSGGPTIFALNPDQDFASQETCTVTVVASKVADASNSSNTMASNYTFKFTTVPGTPGG